jgi:gliding motility-associated lipoprotein GldH
LAESDGRWLGNSAGNLYGQTVLLRENFTFPDTGKYVFSVGQSMRENPLRGINDVGIKIIKR